MLARAVVLIGAATLLITEFLSLFGALRRGPLAVCWAVLLAGAIYWLVRRRPFFGFEIRLDLALFCWIGVCAVFVVTAVTALASPPNGADAMAYHMPRVVYWAEQASVRFFPTPYLNQIMLQPMAEYFMLHTYLLSGGDRFVNLVQWAASVGCVLLVASVAGLFGASRRGRALAALFCATIPAGILASSGAKNDYVLALWLITAVYFTLRFTASFQTIDAVFLGAALGLALLTKGTAYLFAPWPLAAIVLLRLRRSPARIALGGVIALLCAVAVNAPHFARNYGLSGSILGFDSAQGDGRFRWRYETFGWKQTLSNVLRNGSDQLGGRSDRWNRGVFEFVVAAHQSIGIDVNDAATTWRWSSFEPPKNANHEANAPSRWHLCLLVLVTLWLVIKRDQRALYAVALVCAFVCFCGYLKWQPFLARLFLPLFVLGSPLAAVIDEWTPRSAILPAVLALFLLNNARPPLFENWTRPLKGPDSVLRVPRETQYFADMKQWDNQKSYLTAVELLADSSCSTVGIDANNLQLEYPLQVLLRARRPEKQFVHTQVENASAQYHAPFDVPPCAVVCLDCAGDESRLSRYRGFGTGERAGKFVVLRMVP